ASASSMMSLPSTRETLKKISKASVLYFAFAFVFLSHACVPVNRVPTPSAGDSPKGLWGRVTPIADGNHPNLYYNQSAIDELRNMILVHHSPQHLYDIYKNEIRNKFAITTIPDNHSPHARNMEAALSYAIEPTYEKADAIRSSLLSFMRAFPDGLPTWW